MKRLLLLLFSVSLFYRVHAQASDTVLVEVPDFSLYNGVATSVGPNGSTFHTVMRAMYLLPESELDTINVGRLITSLAMNYSVGVTGAKGLFKIYLANTTDAVYSKGNTWDISGMTLVYDDTFRLPETAAIPDIVFSTPLTYTGGSLNLAFEYLAVSFAPNPNVVNYRIYNPAQGPQGATGVSSTTTPPASLSSTNNRPVFRLGYFCEIQKDSIVIDTCAVDYTLNNQTYTSSGIYKQYLTATEGCDSVLTINLTLRDSSSAYLPITACDSFMLNNQSYYSSGVYNQLLTNAAGCDSLITLDLTLLRSTTSLLNRNFCDSFTLNGFTYFSSGLFHQTLTNAVGCDSFLALTLTRIPVDTTITIVGGIMTSNASGAMTFYQWIDCSNGDSIPGANNQQFIPTNNGSYYLSVTQGGCTRRTGCFAMNNAGRMDAFGNYLQVYPNPTNGMLELRSAMPLQQAQISIYTTLGQEVLRLENQQGTSIMLNLGAYPSGLYYVVMEDGANRLLQKVVKE